MTKTKKFNRAAELAGFVVRQRAFVAELESRKFDAVPHLRHSHEKTLQEARVLLAKAEASIN